MVNVSTAFSVSIVKIIHKRVYALERLPLHCVMQYCVYADHRHLLNLHLLSSPVRSVSL